MDGWAAENTDYLALYDAAPEAMKYPLVQRWIKEEPLAFFKQLREQRPVLQTPACVLVANFTDVRDLLSMPKIFTVDLYKPKMAVTGPDDGYLMAHDDDALHYREKSLMQGLLNRKDLPRVRRLVAETAQRILKQADGQIELVENYCRRVPVQLVQKYFGLDGIDAKDLIRWSYWNQYDAFNNQPFDKLTDSEYQQVLDQHDQVSKELGAYIAALMIRKVTWVKLTGPINWLWQPLRNLAYRLLGKDQPENSDDMVSRMLRSKFASEADFPLTRVGVNAGGLLIGAIETTSQAVSQVVEYLINHPDQLQQAKEIARQDDTAGFDAIVWEALRFVPIRPDIFRQAACDYRIAKGTDYETEIKAGSIVRLLIHSAMFDPYAYEDPDRFNPDRIIDHNFVFGFGSHQCLGKYIGMEMIPEMVRQVVLCGDLRSDAKISYRNALFPDRDGPFPEKYPVSWH